MEGIMPRTTSFLTTYGYTRHPNDVDNQCFWCEGHVDGNSWDYTPSRDIMKNPVLRAECPEAPIAVTSCMTCRNRMAYHRLKLLTISRKKEFWAERAESPEAIAEKLHQMKLAKLHSWQFYDEEGHVQDLPDIAIQDPRVLASKRAYYGTATDQTAFVSTPASMPEAEQVIEKVKNVTWKDDF